MEQKVRNALTTLAAALKGKMLPSASDWTNEIMRCMAMLGRSEGHKVAVSGQWDHTEWLYDMVWYNKEGTGEDERLVSVPLVMECELNPQYGKIEDDFEKLLLANADLKVLICRDNPRYHQEMLDYYQSSINGYKQGRTGDTYLIATRREKEDDFELVTLTKK